MRGVEPRIFLFCTFDYRFDVVVVEPVAVFLGCAAIGICRDIRGIFTFRANMKFLVVALTVEILWRNMVSLHCILLLLHPGP